MEFTELTKKEFTTFADKHPLKSFFQTTEMEELGNYGGWTSYYVGVKENNKVIAATRMMSYKNRLGLRYFYAPRGLLLDYKNNELLEFFTKNLKKYIKKKKGYVLRIDPLIVHLERDIDGNIVPNGENNEWCVDALKKLGYKHLGYHKGWSGIYQCRWVYCLDIEGKTIDQILKEMRGTVRNAIKKTQTTGGVIVRELSYDELPIFKKITEEASERKEFQDKSLTYYKNMYKLFSKNNKIKFMISELNTKDYLKGLEEELKNWESSYERTPDNQKNTGKRKELLVSINSTKKRIEEAKELTKKGEIIPLAAAMFMTYGDEVLYYHSGNYKEYIKFNGQRMIQWEMIKYAVQNNYKRYNFYGISGDFEKDDDGVYEFKKGFGGYVEEYIGDFDLPTSWFYYLKK